MSRRTIVTLMKKSLKTLAFKMSSKLIYEDVMGNDIDLEYTILPGRVKESIVLNQRQDIDRYVMNVKNA